MPSNIRSFDLADHALDSLVNELRRLKLADEETVTAAKALRAIGDKRIKYIAFDDSPAVLAAVKDGFAQATFVQNPYGQAYIGAYALDLIASGQCKMKADAPWIKTPQTAHFIDSGVLEVTPDKLATYKDDVKKLTQDIQSKFKATYMDCK